ncbi:MAG: hypothetical protein ACHQSE_15110 [Gemmatimonadales bacterium]
MNCRHMLTLLLDAEAEELEGKGSSVVATHVRECARCGAVALMLRSETGLVAAHAVARDAIAGADGHGGARRPGRFVRGGAIVTAVIVAFAWPRAGARAPRGAPARTVAAAHATATGRQAPAVEHDPSPPTHAPRARLGRAGNAVRVNAVRFADVAPATPVRFAASQSADPPVPPDDSNGVSVAPPAGKSAAVLETRNAKITVVWLY